MCCVMKVSDSMELSFIHSWYWKKKIPKAYFTLEYEYGSYILILQKKKVLSFLTYSYLIQWIAKSETI